MLDTARTPDFRFEDHGSIWLCRPTDQTAADYLSTHVAAHAHWFNRALVVEPRYVDTLATALEEAGFTTEV